MTRTKVTLIRILRSMLAQGLEKVARKQLQGSLNARRIVIARAQDYLSLVRQSGDAKPWIKRTSLDTFISECRRTALSPRVECTLRLKNVEYLMQAAGFLPTTDDPTSKYIASLIEPAKVAPCAQRATESVADILKRLGGDDGTGTPN